MLVLGTSGMLVLVGVLVLLLLAESEEFQEIVMMAGVPLLFAALKRIRVHAHGDAMQEDHLAAEIGRNEHVEDHRSADEEVERPAAPRVRARRETPQREND